MLPPPPPSPAWANFYPHDGIYARKQPLLLCVICGHTVSTHVFFIFFVIFAVFLSLLIGSGPVYVYPQRCCPVLRGAVPRFELGTDLSAGRRANNFSTPQVVS